MDAGQGFTNSFEAWSSNLSSVDNSSTGFVQIANDVSSLRMFIGAPAFAAAGSGYVEQIASALLRLRGKALYVATEGIRGHQEIEHV